jgi:hypothetical protein
MIILIQLCKSCLDDMPYISSLTLQGNLQVSERSLKALISNDSTTECRCLLSRESLLKIEGALMKILVYSIKRKTCIPQEFSKATEVLPSHSQLVDLALHSPGKTLQLPNLNLALKYIES